MCMIVTISLCVSRVQNIVLVVSGECWCWCVGMINKHVIDMELQSLLQLGGTLQYSVHVVSR